MSGHNSSKIAGSLGKNSKNDEKVRILVQYERQLTDATLRVPINVLWNGEKTL